MSVLKKLGLKLVFWRNQLIGPLKLHVLAKLLAVTYVAM